MLDDATGANAPDYSNLVTPFDVERAILELTQELDKMPDLIKKHFNQLQQARKEYRQAFNVAYATAEGTQMDRKVAAEMATEQHAEAVAAAEAQYRYVQDLKESLKQKLRALQSVSSLMKAQMFSPQGGA